MRYAKDYVKIHLITDSLLACFLACRQALIQWQTQAYLAQKRSLLAGAEEGVSC